MPGEHRILAADLETTGPKVSLVSTRRELPAREKKPTGLSLLPDIGAEQDPHEWWGVIRRTAYCLPEGILKSRDRILSMGCTGTWSTLLPVDCKEALPTPALF
jgi:xylulokinase